VKVVNEFEEEKKEKLEENEYIYELKFDFS